MRLDEFQGVNAAYVLELYERFRQDPGSVDPATRRAFESWSPPSTVTAAASLPAPGARDAGHDIGQDIAKIVGAANLADCIRRYGHLAARIDPLGSEPIGDPSLSPAAHGITDEDLEAAAGLARGGTGRRVVCQRLRGDRTAPPRLLLDDRPRLQPRVRAGRARLAAPGRRVRPIPARPWTPITPRPPCSIGITPGRGVRALPAPHVPGQDALLDRGARHAGADPRRDHPRRRPTAARGT